MPVRLLTQSLLRWPEAREVMQAVQVGVHGSDGRADAGFGSDLDLVLIDAAAVGPQPQRVRQWPFEQLPLSCDALVLTPGEWQELIGKELEDPSRRAFVQALRRGCRWLWSREDAYRG